MAMARPRQRVANEIPTMADHEKDKMFTCPYNQYHRITALVYPYHVARCRKQYTGHPFKRCPFNARHEFPEVEYDYHVSSCPDKNFIEKELSIVPAPNVQPLKNETEIYNPEEDWEIEANHTGFSISGDIGIEQDRTAFDEIEAFHDELQDQNVQEEKVQTGSVLSKAQKKNMKRAQKRRDKHIANGDMNGDHDDNGGIEESKELTEAQKNETLQQIAKEYAIPGRPCNAGAAFVDWVSILNIYCQKNKINSPKYSEASNPHGGFGSAVVVTTERFFSDAYCKTKKDAKHSAARAALLGLKIAISLPDPSKAPHVGARDLQRAREVEERAAYLKTIITNEPRVIPGLNSQHPPNPVVYSSSSSSSQQAGTSAQSVTSQMSRVTIQNEEDEWQVAGSRRRELKPAGNNALRLAGIGRGRARR